MTHEEAIKHFKSLQKRYTKEHNGRMCEKVNLALEALEKQIPKKLKDDGWLYCPICGRDVLMDRFDYCPDCGQALDWSDDNA